MYVCMSVHIYIIYNNFMVPHSILVALTVWIEHRVRDATIGLRVQRLSRGIFNIQQRTCVSAFTSSLYVLLPRASPVSETFAESERETSTYITIPMTVTTAINIIVIRPVHTVVVCSFTRLYKDDFKLSSKRRIQDSMRVLKHWLEISDLLVLLL